MATRPAESALQRYFRLTGEDPYLTDVPSRPVVNPLPGGGVSLPAAAPPPPPASGGGGGGGGAAAGTPPPPDWSAYLGIFGLPSDVQNELNAIFARTPDVNQAVSLALAYVRGTQWYSQTYPGIQEAMAKGLVRNEADYRSRMNDFNQVYRQYMSGQDLTSGQFAEYLREGITADTLGRRFQGLALENVYSPDWQYLSGNFGEGRLSDDERRAFGRQQAGLDSELGLRIQRRLQQAQERVRAVFSGTLATSRLPRSLEGSGDMRLPDVGR